MAPREEIVSSRLSLETEIDQFRLEEEGEARGEPVEISNLEGALDRSSTVRYSKLIVTQVDSSSEEEEEMAFNPRKGLKELIVGRNKRLSSKDAPKSQSLPALPPPLSLTLNLLPMPNLKKKRNEKEGAKEGELVPQKEPKQHRTARDRGRASSVESKEAEHSAHMHHLAWNPQLKLDGAAVP